MDLLTAKLKLEAIIGRDLREMAEQYNVTVFKQGNLNKGWAGHVLESYLGLGLDSSQAPNGGTWELKLVPLVYRNGVLHPKETMAITMIDPYQVRDTPFEESHLLQKLRIILLCARIYESKQETHSILRIVKTAGLDDPKLYGQVKADYDLVRETIRSQGFQHLHGRMGKYVQPRTKGPGHGSTSRAFYARTNFLSILLGLTPIR
jgi:DNA mismatch repair protein MutH